MRIWQRTLESIRADFLIRQSCWVEGDSLFLSGSVYDLSAYDRIFVLGAGKASAAMAQAIEPLLGDRLEAGLIVTKEGHSLPLSRIETLEAAHPVPDERSVLAGRRIFDFARTATGRDLVIGLISGGASALMEAPVEGIELQDIVTVTAALLRAGAEIHELNVVRSCLSRIKAGGLARACGDAAVVCLLLSDVIGNSREAIGSGPFWGAPPHGKDALEVLRRHDIPTTPAIEAALARDSSAVKAQPEHIVIGDIFTLLECAQRAAEEVGFRPKVYGRTFDGEAREVGARMAAEALALIREGETYDCVIAAGETTVTVRGSGIGGRSQELACAAAIALGGVEDVALLAAGTDGTDGPTDAAGGLIDGTTAQRADLRAALARNDAYRALAEADALISTGPTQTNLNDLVVITRVSES